MCGGSAGDGGKGGLGGRPGFVKIIELADKSSIKTSAEKGAVGDGATGGSNGRNPSTCATPSAINMGSPMLCVASGRRYQDKGI